MFVGHRVRRQGDTLIVDQGSKIEKLQDIIEKSSKDDTLCAPRMHTECRGVLGNINWLQFRTQFHIACRFSRAASAAANPTICDVKELSEIVRAARAQPVRLISTHSEVFLGFSDTLTPPSRIMLTSPRCGQCIFLGEAGKGTKDSTDPVREERAWYTTSQPR